MMVLNNFIYHYHNLLCCLVLKSLLENANKVYPCLWLVLLSFKENVLSFPFFLSFFFPFKLCLSFLVIFLSVVKRARAKNSSGSNLVPMLTFQMRESKFGKLRLAFVLAMWFYWVERPGWSKLSSNNIQLIVDPKISWLYPRCRF